MIVARIHQPDYLSVLYADWNRLAGGNPFRRFEWLVSWWRSFAVHGWELFVIVVRDDAGRVTLIAPWYTESSLARGRVVKFLGSNAVCTDHLSLLVDPMYEREAVAALGIWLKDAAEQPPRSGEPSRTWDAMELSAIDGDDESILQLSHRLEQQGLMVERIPAGNCWVIDVPQQWEDYLARLNGSQRHSARRVWKAYVDTGRAQVNWPSGQDLLDQGWEMLIDLHQRRRAMLGQPGIFADPAFASFLRTASFQLAEMGLMRLAVLLLDGRPAGVKLLFQDGNCLFDYNGGIEPELLDAEPGRLLNLMVLHQAMREGIRCLDLLRGDEPYKSHARAKPQPTWDVRIVPRAVLSQWRHSVWSIGMQLKDWLKGSLRSLTSGRWSGRIRWPLDQS